MKEAYWSDESKNLTRQYFSENNVGCVKSKGLRYGILFKKTEDLSCMIKIIKTDEILNFNDLEEAIFDGWILD